MVATPEDGLAYPLVEVFFLQKNFYYCKIFFLSITHFQFQKIGVETSDGE